MSFKVHTYVRVKFTGYIQGFLNNLHPSAPTLKIGNALILKQILSTNSLRKCIEISREIYFKQISGLEELYLVSVFKFSASVFPQNPPSGWGLQHGITFGHPVITLTKTLLTRLLFKFIFEHVLLKNKKNALSNKFCPPSGLLCKGVGWVASVKLTLKIQQDLYLVSVFDLRCFKFSASVFPQNPQVGGAFSPCITFGHPVITLAKTSLTKLFFKFIFKHMLLKNKKNTLSNKFLSP